MTSHHSDSGVSRKRRYERLDGPVRIHTQDEHAFLLQDEHEWIRARRRHAKRASENEPLDPNSTPPKDLVGLALSGGGIRSAAFNLGLLQAMKRHRVFNQVDYLSTVSGGGYIGSTLTWLMAQRPKGEAAFPLSSDEAGGSATSSRGGADGTGSTGRSRSTARNGYVDFIRQHGKYLTPGRGLNTWALGAQVVRGIGVNLVIFIPAFLLLVWLASRPWGTWSLWTEGACRLVRGAGDVGALGACFRWRPEALESGAPGAGTASGSQNWIASPHVDGFFAFFLLGIAAFGLLGLLYFLTAMPLHEKLERDFVGRGRVATIFGRLLLVGITGTFVGCVPLMAFIVHQNSRGWGEAVTASLSLAGVVSFVIGWRSAGDTGAKQKSAVLLPLGLSLVLLGLLLGLYHYAAHDPVALNTTTLIVVGFLLFFLILLANVNHLSLHRYYRDRLMEAFMPDVPGARDTADEFRLKDITPTSGAPYHIINTNLITLNSNDDKLRARGGDNFLFSPLYCGSPATGYARTDHYVGGNAHLATAFAISGAALDPNTGFTRSRPLAAVMSLLNVRLGYWMRNPSTTPKKPLPDRETPSRGFTRRLQRARLAIRRQGLVGEEALAKHLTAGELRRWYRLPLEQRSLFVHDLPTIVSHELEKLLPEKEQVLLNRSVAVDYVMRDNGAPLLGEERGLLIPRNHWTRLTADERAAVVKIWRAIQSRQTSLRLFLGETPEPNASSDRDRSIRVTRGLVKLYLEWRDTRDAVPDLRALPLTVREIAALEELIEQTHVLAHQHEGGEIDGVENHGARALESARHLLEDLAAAVSHEGRHTLTRPQLLQLMAMQRTVNRLVMVLQRTVNKPADISAGAGKPRAATAFGKLRARVTRVALQLSAIYWRLRRRAHETIWRPLCMQTGGVLRTMTRLLRLPVRSGDDALVLRHLTVRELECWTKLPAATQSLIVHELTRFTVLWEKLPPDERLLLARSVAIEYLHSIQTTFSSTGDKAGTKEAPFELMGLLQYALAFQVWHKIGGVEDVVYLDTHHQSVHTCLKSLVAEQYVQWGIARCLGTARSLAPADRAVLIAHLTVGEVADLLRHPDDLRLLLHYVREDENPTRPWILHVRHWQEQEGGRSSADTGQSLRGKTDAQGLQRRKRKKLRRWSLYWLSYRYLLLEMLGVGLNERSGYVHLSDGGHFENLGLYELIRRRCRYIIVSDATGDPGWTLKDLARACMLARVDLGADVRIDTEPLRPKEEKEIRSMFKVSKVPSVVGEITYANGDKGHILYINTTLIKGLSDELLAYCRDNPDFPDESTADQFFDERQFEAYRELGWHIGEKVFKDGREGATQESESVKHVFCQNSESVNSSGVTRTVSADERAGRHGKLVALALLSGSLTEPPLTQPHGGA